VTKNSQISGACKSRCAGEFVYIIPKLAAARGCSHSRVIAADRSNDI
jgi:hypothetical protein